MPVVSVQDFTGVYAEQPFMQGLLESAATDKNIHWFDCSAFISLTTAITTI